jgi:hypothetical protein
MKTCIYVVMLIISHPSHIEAQVARKAVFNGVFETTSMFKRTVVKEVAGSPAEAGLTTRAASRVPMSDLRDGRLRQHDYAQVSFIRAPTTCGERCNDLCANQPLRERSVT